MKSYAELYKISLDLKRRYNKGDRVELVKMDDPHVTIPVGTKGTVCSVDDIATIHVNWDNGSSLGVAYGEDIVRKIRGELLV